MKDHHKPTPNPKSMNTLVQKVPGGGGGRGDLYYFYFLLPASSYFQNLFASAASNKHRTKRAGRNPSILRY
jgi:hypothetical protein